MERESVHRETVEPTGPTAAPSDNTTLRAVLSGYAQAGFDADFMIEDAEQAVVVRCVTCGFASSPEDIVLYSLRRVEGASDPADMAAVLALECPKCAARGTAVVRFGPEASVAEGDVMRAVRDLRTSDVLPFASAPDEGNERRH